jgi:hypothetical protein
MEIQTRKVWAAALLAITVMALTPGRALAQGMDPGELKQKTDSSAGVPITDPSELKARMESFSTGVGAVTDPGELKAMTESFAYEIPEMRVLEQGELKRIAEAPARFAVLDPGELKALMESGARPISEGDSTTVAHSGGVGWSDIGVMSLILLLTVGAAVSFNRWRHDHIAPA